MSGGYQIKTGAAVYVLTVARNALAHGVSAKRTVIGEWCASAPVDRSYTTMMGPMVPPPSDPAEPVAVVPGNHEITPKTGALTVEGASPSIVTGEPTTILDGVTLRATGTVTLHATGTLSELARFRPVLPWLDSAAVFIPKSIREPFVGDLREDMTERLAAGWSPTRVKWVAISQVAILAVRWLWSPGWFRALRGGGP
jgi:hypothetical protein